MYLNIGKDCIIKSENIIGIFNIKYIKNTKEYKALYQKLEEEKNIFLTTEKSLKTLILTNDKNREKAYFTNIGVYTITKRLI